MSLSNEHASKTHTYTVPYPTWRTFAIAALLAAATSTVLATTAYDDTRAWLLVLICVALSQLGVADPLNAGEAGCATVCLAGIAAVLTGGAAALADGWWAGYAMAGVTGMALGVWTGAIWKGRVAEQRLSHFAKTRKRDDAV